MTAADVDNRGDRVTENAATRNILKSHLDTVEQQIRIKSPELVVRSEDLRRGKPPPNHFALKPILHEECAFAFGFASVS
jgi:hypothetical protein